MLNNIRFDKRFVNISTTVEINDTTIFVTINGTKDKLPTQVLCLLKKKLEQNY